MSSYIAAPPRTTSHSHHHFSWSAFLLLLLVVLATQRPRSSSRSRRDSSSLSDDIRSAVASSSISSSSPSSASTSGDDDPSASLITSHSSSRRGVQSESLHHQQQQQQQAYSPHTHRQPHHRSSSFCLDICRVLVNSCRRSTAYGSLPHVDSDFDHDSHYHQYSVMDLFRSEDMKYVSITMTNDAAHSTVRELGKLGKLHVVDLGGGEGVAPSKEHTAYKKRLGDCQFWERKLQSLSDELVRFDIANEGAQSNINYEPQEVQSADILASVQQLVEPIEKELQQNLQFLSVNRRAIAKQIELRHTLTETKDLDLAGQTRMMARRAQAPVDPSSRSLLAQQSSSSLNPSSIELEAKGDEESGAASGRDPNSFRNFVCGIIPDDQQPAFRRMLYRVSRGNAFAQFKNQGEMTDPATGEKQRKSVFYVMILGQTLYQRIVKMCELFRASVYEIPSTRDEFHQTLQRIREDIADKEAINRRTEESVVTLLTRLGNENGTSPLRNYQIALQEEKSVCSVMMKAHYYLTMICVEGWIPTQEIPNIKQCLKAAVAGTGHPPAAIDIDPSNPIKLAGAAPTYFKLTPFTSAFQGIVDTYGVPRYKEVNPGLFTIISFPFLFGVMYGDIGHGCLLTAAAIAMIYWEDILIAKQKAGTLSEIPTMVFGGRYTLIMMGLFAVYCGIIYNDCFSIPTNVYGSAWVDAPDVAVTGAMHNPTGWTYPCGVDPSWAHKTNSLAFANSLKMKMAVILGVCHMLFGISLSLFNHLYFKDMLSVYFEFIPKLVFMLSTFGYMIWMILYKWCQDWNVRGNPPNLIQTMIAMFLSPGSVDADKQLYQGQAGFQTFLLLCAFVSVPTMLFVKPYLNKKKHEEEAAHRALNPVQHSAGSRANLYEDVPSSDAYGEEEQKVSIASVAQPSHSESESEGAHGHSFSDEMIHSGIHTIEFVLGAVSNTASYLRLWALSLAHAQLSEVFWSKMIMQYGAFTGNAFGMFIGFGLWAVSTFAVLLCMDVLECFLHALRLHWVEFQNKFYYADGIAFEPFVLVPQESDKN